MALLLFAWSTPSLYAQFNPVNPPEPEENIYYNVSVSPSHANAAYTYGSGKYSVGTNVTVRYSMRNSVDYVFSHWTLNGEYYSDKSSFVYTVVAGDAVFVAHFRYTPASPQEPSAKDEHKLFLEASHDAACSFNVSSGITVEYDNYITLTTYVNQGYDFLGWYRNGVLVNSNTTFNFLMPFEDVTLVAKFNYNPFNPAEPEGDGSQENVDVKPNGDVNKDGVVDILDVVAIVNYSLAEEDVNKNDYDVNGDGVIDIMDVVKVVNISLE